MFLSKDGLEVVRVDCGIASIPLFRIDVPSSSKSIWFCAEMTRLNWKRYLDHCTYLRINTLVVEKYSRFL